MGYSGSDSGGDSGYSGGDSGYFGGDSGCGGGGGDSVVDFSAEEVDVFKCKQMDMARSWDHKYLLLVFWSGTAEAFPARSFITCVLRLIELVGCHDCVEFVDRSVHSCRFLSHRSSFSATCLSTLPTLSITCRVGSGQRRTLNSNTIVPAPLGIEPNTIKYQPGTTASLHNSCQVASHFISSHALPQNSTHMQRQFEQVSVATLQITCELTRYLGYIPCSRMLSEASIFSNTLITSKSIKPSKTNRHQLLQHTQLHTTTMGNSISRLCHRKSHKKHTRLNDDPEKLEKKKTGECHPLALEKTATLASKASKKSKSSMMIRPRSNTATITRMRTIEDPSNAMYARLNERPFAEAESGSAGRAVSLSVDPEDGDSGGATCEVPESGGGDEGGTSADCGLEACENGGDSGYGGDSGCGGGDSGVGCSAGDSGYSAGDSGVGSSGGDSGYTAGDSGCGGDSGGCC